jgi:adenosine kinase
MGKFGNISAVYAIEHAGATEHTFSIEEYMQRFNENYAHS